MLHLAVVTSADRTDRVVDALLDERGVVNVTRFPGAVLVPEGDRIEADVAREATNDVVERLRPLLGGSGSIALSELTAGVGTSFDRAEAEAPGLGVDAVVWEQVADRTAEDATLSATFLVFMVIATLIGAVGVMTDSPILVVGAMVLGPEFGPLAATAVALVERRPMQVWRSFRALLVGFPVAIAVTAAGVALLQLTIGIPAGYLQGDRPLTSFASTPDVLSVVVALLAGVAGMISLTASKASAIVGVFISATTIPAAADLGASLVTGRYPEAGGAVEQLVLNLACILVAATATLRLQQVLLQRKRMRRTLTPAMGDQRPAR